MKRILILTIILPFIFTSYVFAYTNSYFSIALNDVSEISKEDNAICHLFTVNDNSYIIITVSPHNEKFNELTQADVKAFLDELSSEYSQMSNITNTKNTSKGLSTIGAKSYKAINLDFLLYTSDNTEVFARHYIFPSDNYIYHIIIESFDLTSVNNLTNNLKSFTIKDSITNWKKEKQENSYIRWITEGISIVVVLIISAIIAKYTKKRNSSEDKKEE